MGKKILYMILGALAIFGLLFLLWSWFFSSAGGTKTTGTLGNAGDTSQTLGTGADTGNGQTAFGSNTNGTQRIGSGQNVNGSIANTNNAGTNGGTSGSGATLGTVSNVAGVNWLPANSTGSAGNGFKPISINGIDNGIVGGTVPTIGGSVTNSSSGGGSGTNMFLAAGLIGAISCSLQAFMGIGGAAVGGATGAAGMAGVPVSNPTFGVTSAGVTTVATQSTANQTRSFQACIINTIAKAALSQITASVVNWINGGFNGKPSFITNYNQFFKNVADAAAGQFIQGAGLSFLCSQFGMQIKIAVAQSYANRGAQSCTLTKVINNVNSFMKGNFAQGGWGGLISYTTIPTNNPYGAFAYAQVGLATAQQNALSSANRSITPGGFLALQQVTCNGQTSIKGIVSTSQASIAGGVVPNNCKPTITTPGTVIENSLSSTLDTPLKQLGLANSLDQIINALLNQLMVRTLQNGLSNLSGVSGYQSNFQTPEEQAAQQNAQGMLADMQSTVVFEQQLGAIAQGSIGDIQATQTQLNNLLNCWNAVITSGIQVDRATTAASSTNALLTMLNARATFYNDSITQINSQIANLQQLQSEALSVSSSADVQTLTNDYATARSTNPFATEADVTTAQQNRTALQAELSAQNTLTQVNMAQCNAIH